MNLIRVVVAAALVTAIFPGASAARADDICRTRTANGDICQLASVHLKPGADWHYLGVHARTTTDYTGGWTQRAVHAGLNLTTIRSDVAPEPDNFVVEYIAHTAYGPNWWTRLRLDRWPNLAHGRLDLPVPAGEQRVPFSMRIRALPGTLPGGYWLSLNVSPYDNGPDRVTASVPFYVDR
jgi:hypothetical protein